MTSATTPTTPTTAPVPDTPRATAPARAARSRPGAAASRSRRRPRGATEPPGPVESGGTHDGPVLDHPAELARSVPALLGFHPRDSLVLVSLGGTTGQLVGLVLRTDLPPRSASPTQLDDVARHVVHGLLRDSPQAAAVMVFARARGAHLPHRRLVDAVVAGLEDHEVTVCTAFWAEDTAAGARWACYDPCGCTGTLSDPTASVAAAAGVLSGQVVHGSRSDMERMLEPADPAALRRREELIRRTGECARDVLDTEPESTAAALLAVDTAIADAGEGQLVLDDHRVVELARALATPAVRDAAVLRCLGTAASAAEQLWTALVRETPDPEAAEPAVLLAVSALLRGDGGLANIALDRAERAWPGHRLTELIAMVAHAATPPAEVRRLLRDSLTGVPAARSGRRRPGGSGSNGGESNGGESNGGESNGGRSAGGRSVRRAGGGSARTARRRRPSC